MTIQQGGREMTDDTKIKCSVCDGTGERREMKNKTDDDAYDALFRSYEGANKQIKELQEQLAYEQERNENNVANADYQIAELRAEIIRLRAGGCAREQGATQYCAEAATWSNAAARYAEHIAKMDMRLEEAKELLLQAHEPDQGQLRTQWDKDVDEWIKKTAHSGKANQ